MLANAILVSMRVKFVIVQYLPYVENWISFISISGKLEKFKKGDLFPRILAKKEI